MAPKIKSKRKKRSTEVLKKYEILKEVRDDTKKNIVRSGGFVQKIYRGGNIKP